MKYDYVIIDPVSPEVNRGSFCYSPYILTSALRGLNKSVYLMEDFSITQQDDIPDCDKLLISVWSYPQIDAALMLMTFLRDKNPEFFGYAPLIMHYGLPVYIMSRTEIQVGIVNYSKNYGSFKHLLLSDCDLHLNKFIQEDRNNVVYPLFEAYGCSNRCSFCPSSANQSNPITIQPEKLIETIKKAHRRGVRNIHFTGENFFRNKFVARELLSKIAEADLGMYFICLSTVHSLVEFLDCYGGDLIDAAGLKVIEVGLESASDDIQKGMGKYGFNKKSVRLAEEAKKYEFELFWLTMTFFPGETVGSIRATGEFLKKYGLNYEDVHPRIATNSTVGGLGQFFQPYHGTKGFASLQEDGFFLTERPMRLRPSFVPFSFLSSVFVKVREWNEDDFKWLALYGIKPEDTNWPNYNIGQEHIVSRLQKLNQLEDKGFIHKDPCIKELTILAVASRLGVIEEVLW